MARSMVIYGPQGCGKTRNAEKLCQQHGLDKSAGLEDFWRGAAPPAEGMLILHYDYTQAAAFALKHDLRLLDFKRAMNSTSGGSHAE